MRRVIKIHLDDLDRHILAVRECSPPPHEDAHTVRGRIVAFWQWAVRYTDGSYAADTHPGHLVTLDLALQIALVSRSGDRIAVNEWHRMVSLPKPDRQDDPSDPHGAAIDMIAKHYQKYHPRAHVTSIDRGRIRARLDEGFCAAEICEAIDGCHASPFHSGQNETGQVYQALSLIVRSADKVRGFMELNRRREPPRKLSRAEADILQIAEEARRK